MPNLYQIDAQAFRLGYRRTADVCLLPLRSIPTYLLDYPIPNVDNIQRPLFVLREPTARPDEGYRSKCAKPQLVTGIDGQ